MKGRLFVVVSGLVAGLTALTAVTALAQRGFGGFGRGSGAPIEPNTPYDGRFTFVRIRYGPPIAYQSQRIPWSHDYPEGERNMMKILNEISNLGPHTHEVNVMALDDGSDGNLASTLFLQSPRARTAAIAATADPALRALLEQKQALEDQIAALKARKSKMDPAAYEVALEKLVTDLALKTRAIQQLEGKKP